MRVGQQWRERGGASGCASRSTWSMPTSSSRRRCFPAEEYAARTIRPKIHRLWDEYLEPLPNPNARVRLGRAAGRRAKPIEPDALLGKLKVGGVGEVPGYRGGTREALRRLRRFVRERLPRYATERNEPTPYCHERAVGPPAFRPDQPAHDRPGASRAAGAPRAASTPISRS